MTLPYKMRSSRQDNPLAFLKKVLLFADLSDDELVTLSNDLQLREYGKDEIIFHHRDDSRALYIIAEGKIRIFKSSPSGDETTIQLFAAHDVIGEFAIIDGLPRSATARAIEHCTLWVMMQNSFLRHMREMPNLALGMARLLVSKARWTAAYAETIAQYDAAGRLLHTLLLYAQDERFCREIEAGKRYELDFSLNQEDLASMVGARREWVNRILRGWRERGLIEYDAGKIIILDLPAVERERDSRIEVHRGETEW